MPAITTLTLSGQPWRVRPYHANEGTFSQAWNAEPVPSLEYPAQVPGDVATDVLRAEDGPHPYVDLNSRLYEWTSTRDWLYRLEFECPALDGRQARLEFDAVDYECTVWLNGHKLGGHRGASDAFRLAASEALREGTNRLLVMVSAAPPEPGQIGRTSEVRTWKPRFAYGWDWNCRLVPLGIYGDVRLVLHEGACLEDSWWRVRLEDNHESADLLLLGTVGSDTTCYARVVGEARSPGGGGVVARSESEVLLAPGACEVQVALRIDEPELWWPNGYGEQPLYAVTLRVEPEGHEPIEQTRRVGIREVTWQRTDTAPADSLPYTPVVNGRPVYLTGFNWAPPDNLHGFAAPKYRPTVELAKQCRANVLRVWGGAHLPRPDFYEACDECGILVWQEFCQSSSGIDNKPPTDAGYIAGAVREARGIVRRVRGSTCLIAWSGGNELMDDQGIPLTLEHPTVRALGEVARELDPDRFYFPTSASGPTEWPSFDFLGRMHDVHGPWTFDAPTGHYRLYDGVDALLHSEMGAPGAANPEALAKWVSPGRVWPPDATNPIWMQRGAWWINKPQVDMLFGPVTDLGDFIVASQYLQCEGLRYALEAARRRQWRCAGTIIWQFNDCYPTTSCTCVLDYDLQPKPAFSAVRRSYGPVIASARYEGLDWHGKEALEAGIFVSGAVPDAGPATVRAQLLDLTGAVRFEESRTVELGEPGSLRAFDVDWPLAGLGVFVLRVSVENAHAAPDQSCDYLLSHAEGPLFAEVWEGAPVPVTVRRAAEGILLRSEGDRLALPLVVTLKAADGSARIPEDNLFALRPGEERRVWSAPEEVTAAVRGFRVAAV